MNTEIKVINTKEEMRQFMFWDELSEALIETAKQKTGIFEDGNPVNPEARRNEYNYPVRLFCHAISLSHEVTFINTVRSKWHEQGFVYRYNLRFYREGRGIREYYDTDFFGSIADCQKGEKGVDLYTAIACMQWSTPDSFEEFCLEYGYDEDSRKAEKIHHDCLEQSKNLKRIVPDQWEREMLSQIR